MVFFTRLASAAARFSRWAMAAALCALVFVANVQPASAFGGSGSKPSDGVVQLDKVEQRSKDVLKNGPRDGDAVASRAEGGLNGVQGGADASKMSTPANSPEATTVADNVKGAIKDMKN